MDRALAFQSTSVLAEMIRSRKISSEELTAFYLGRIEKFNGKINAVVAMDADRALAQAKAADAQLAAGGDVGPLHGVPFTIKDSFEFAGLPTTAGAPELAGHIPKKNAVAVELLRRAGAVIIGKTNVPLYAGDLQSYNEVYGQTNNPYRLDRTCGGSSGGAAATLAAGLAGGEIGSDIGGSIRTPAHFNGIFGLKTSFGLVSRTGHIPPPPGYAAVTDLSVAGPLGRSADDLDLLLNVLAQPEPTEPAWQVVLPEPRTRNASELRIAVWSDDPSSPVEAEIRKAVEEAGTALKAAGAQVDFDARPDFTFASSAEIYEILLGAIMSSGLPRKVIDRLIASADSFDQDDKSHQALQARGAALRHFESLALLAKREGIKAKWAAFFQTYDAVLCPVSITTAFEHDHNPNFHARRLTINGVSRPYMDVIDWAGPAVVAHLPAASAPVTINDDGVPIGVQIIGPLQEDRTVTQVAREIEKAFGGFQPPAGFD